MPKAQTVRLFCWVLGACFAAAGLFFVAAGMGVDERGERLAIFREFLRRAEGFPPVPLPEALQAQPPQYLQAAWQPGGSRQATFFQLKLLEVPLTADVLGDVLEGDEAGLLHPTNAEGVWRSKLYRAVVPVGNLWLAGLDPANHDLSNSIGAGVLRISLTNGSTLLEHTFEPLRWLRNIDCRQGSDASSCGGLSVAARLCYALPSGDGPWNGAETYDCEHSHRSPVYIPLQRHSQHHRGEVEIIVRSRADIYVHASEVTRGCSNCQGRPYGSEASVGTDTLACGMTNSAEHHVLNRVWEFALGRPPCFGHPVRRLRSVGLSMWAFSFFSFALATSLKSLRR